MISISKKTLIIGVVAVVILVVLLLLFVGQSVVATSASSQRKIPIYRVDTKEKKIAITFDASWGNQNTKEITELLKKYNAHSTFFLVGDFIDKYPSDVQMFLDGGHEIGGHSQTHPDMTKIAESEVLSELKTVKDKITKLSGQESILFRAPYGAYNDLLLEKCEELGLYCIQWDVDSIDWQNPSVDTICNRVLSKVQNGSIILFHNNSENVVAALEVLLPQLTKQGYSLVKVSDLIYQDSYFIDSQGTQKQK